MSNFINTIDVLGDDVVMVKVVERTIDEFKDNVIENVGIQAFGGCSNLVKVDLPVAKNLDTSAFNGCSSLEEANLPLVTSIGNYAFGSCSKLAKLEFRYRVTTINQSAFTGCSGLKVLILRNINNVTAICSLKDTSAFTGTPIASGTGYIYVPSVLVDSYKADSKWSTYANQFRALEDYTVDGTTTGELDPTKI